MATILTDSHLRSWMKSISWRLIGVIILGGLSWLFTHSWEQTTLITATFHAIRLVLYYYHERVWERVRWGRSAIQQDGVPGEDRH